MDLRYFAIAVLLSLLPFVATSSTMDEHFSKADFVSARPIKTASGKTVVSAKLSPEGKRRAKEFNKYLVGKKVPVEIGDVTSQFVMRVPITGDGLEMGPFSDQEAATIVREINKR